MNLALKLASVTLVAGCITSTAHAQITQFRNGDVADANAINRNFTTVSNAAAAAQATAGDAATAANGAQAAADAAAAAAGAAQNAADGAQGTANQARSTADQARAAVTQLQGRIDPLLAVVQRSGSEVRFTALPDFTRGVEFDTGTAVRFGDEFENTDPIFFRRVRFGGSNSNVSGLDLVLGDDPNNSSADFFRIGTEDANGSNYQDRFFFRSDGVAAKPGGGSWAAISDRRTKRDIEPLQGALERLLELRGTTFFYKEPEKYGGTAEKQIGFVAQEVEQVFPQWVHQLHDGTKFVSITGFEALTVESLRELTDRNAALEKQNAALIERLARIERQLGLAPSAVPTGR